MGVEDEAQVAQNILEKMGADLPTEPTPPVSSDAEQQPEPPAEGDTSRPRDAQGRFVPAGEAEPDRLYAGKYKTIEEMEEAYKQSERALHERFRQDAMQRQQPPQEEVDVDWLEELVDEDPVTAAEMAREAGDQAAYQRVMQRWASDPDGAVAARLYHQNALLQAQMESQKQQFEASMQPVQQQMADARLANAFVAVANRHPEVTGMAEEMAEAAAQAPELAYAMQYPGQEERALEQIYSLAIARRLMAGQPLPQQQAPPQPVAQQPPYVASATGTQPPGDTTSGDPDADFKAAFRALAENSVVSVSRGITRDPQP